MDKLVERALAARIPGQLGPSEDLDGQERWIVCEQLHDTGPKRLCEGGPPNSTPVAFAGIVDVRDVGLSLDPTNASDRDVGERGDFALPVAGCSENLNRVPLEHVDHPFPRCVKQRVSLGEGQAQSGQNFRKGSGQNFRNPHFDAQKEPKNKMESQSDFAAWTAAVCVEPWPMKYTLHVKHTSF